MGQVEAQGGPEVAKGKALFQQKCGFCHGPDAKGGEGPDLLQSSLVSHDDGGNLIGQVLREGRPAKGMPSFQFSEAEVREIAAFIHDQARAAAALYLSGKSPDYPLERLLVGNAASGKAFFNGDGKCAQCHSPSGDLSHIASKYKPIDLQNQMVYPKGDKSTVTVTLPDGTTITGKQVYADNFRVTLRDAGGWTHTYNRSEARIDIQDPLAVHKQLLMNYSDKNIHDLFAYLETLK
ncbi:MAG TPA: cytochrome c [Bryobacteraceae bacterium]|nr:cytochrome c [Bryobacteraceae bacterium]